MRELLVTITLLSVVSSEESEPNKRFELPPEVDPNFWPVRGRRSYWDIGPPDAPLPFSKNFIDEENEPRDGISGRETNNYASYTSSSKTSRFRPGPGEIVFDHEGELRAYFDAQRGDTCPRKRSISLVFPLSNYRSDDIGTNYFCGGRCAGDRGGGGGGSQIMNGRRRGGNVKSRMQQPLYVDEPGWIAIDYSRGNFEEREKNEDPFFIARGKRVEGCGNGESSKRRLEEVLDTYTAGPFFVARGKKQTYDEEIGGNYPGSRYEASNSPPSSKRFQEFRFGSNVDLRYPMGWHRRTRRGASSRNREEEEEEEKEKEKEKKREYAGAVKFSRDHYSDKGRTLTMDKSSTKDFHAYGEINEEKEYPTKNIFKKNDNYNNNNDNNDNNSKYYDKLNVDAVSDIKLPLSSLVLHRLSTRGFLADYESRNAQTQSDKHSNLQSILDEPFFISRGRKRQDGASRTPGYLREVRGDDLPIKNSAPSPPLVPSSSPEDKPVIISDIFNIYRGRKTSSLYYDDEVEKKSNKNKNGDDNDSDTNYYENSDEKSKNQHRQLNIGTDLFYKQFRNRRGMLDDLLSSDDPFYVARGKRLQLRRPIVTIENKINTDRENKHSTTAAAAEANKLSIYAKTLTRRTKMLRKLSDLKMPNNFYLYNITNDRTVKKIT